jgi:hypothetical protein
MPGCKIWNRWYCLKQNKLSGHENFYWPLLSTCQQPTGSNVPHEDKFQTLTAIKLVGRFFSVSGGKIVHPTYARPPPSYIGNLRSYILNPLNWEPIVLIYCGKCAAVSQANIHGVLVLWPSYPLRLALLISSCRPCSCQTQTASITFHHDCRRPGKMQLEYDPRGMRRLVLS